MHPNFAKIPLHMIHNMIYNIIIIYKTQHRSAALHYCKQINLKKFVFKKIGY